MPRRLLAFVFAAWAFLAVCAAANAAEPVFPTGLRVGLAPPEGFKPSKRFPGFEDVDRKAGIAILELPSAAYPQLERDSEARIQPSLTEVKGENFTFNGGSGKLITAAGQGSDFKLHRWLLLANLVGQDLALLINAEVPDAAYDVYSDAVIRKALSTVTFRPTPTQERLGLLPFKLGDLAGFRVMKVLAGGVILIDGPGDDLNTKPYVIISVGPGSPDQPDDRAKFARDMLSSAPLPELRMQNGEQMRIGNMPGYEIRGQAKALNGEPLALVQWVRFTGTSFLRVVGVSRQTEWDALFPRFRAVRDGIGPREN
ncbi:MAG: hypothetical protein ACREB2_01095 [Pseudolabrys sp.]